MYSLVLMVAATSGGDMASFGGKDKGGCHGTVASAGCSGGGFLGGHKSGCSGGGFLGLRDKAGCSGGGFLGGHKSKSGCHGSTYSGGCSGAWAAPAPAPTPVVVAAPTGCHGSAYSGGCSGGGFLGLRSGGGLFGKKKGGCHGH